MRKVRCLKCTGCLRTNCGTCSYCLDMKKYGGQNKLKQACVLRVCHNKKFIQFPQDKKCKKLDKSHCNDHLRKINSDLGEEPMDSSSVPLKDITYCSEIKPLECELCAKSFPWEEFLYHTELSHSHPCTHQVDPESDNEPHLQFVSSYDLAWHVHRDHGGPRPFVRDKTPEMLDAASLVNYSSSEQSDFEERDSSFDMDCEFGERSRSFLDSVKCTLCDNMYSNTRELIHHMKTRHSTGKLEQKPLFWCEWCQKDFVNQRLYEEHNVSEHKFECLIKGCKRKYVSKPDLDQHTKISHDRILSKTERFICSLCDLEFMEFKWLQRHLQVIHSFHCSIDKCRKKYTSQKNLSSHLIKIHGVSYANVCGSEDDRMTLTSARSETNVKMAESAEEWVRSEAALDHMVKVMKGEFQSRRHDLFMDRKERELCGGLKTSKLYVLSNPGFMGEGGEKDSAVIQYLIDNVFKVHFDKSDPRLREIGIEAGFAYATTVLFPETFLNQHQVRNGLVREQAEKAFMEIKVSEEERKGLDEDIRERVAEREAEMNSDDDCVDTSDNEEVEEDVKSLLETSNSDIEEHDDVKSLLETSNSDIEDDNVKSLLETSHSDIEDEEKFLAESPACDTDDDDDDGIKSLLGSDDDDL